MRTFITVLIIIFNLQTWTKADDIRDFEIEGISIGESLMDHMNIKQFNIFKKHNTNMFIHLLPSALKMKTLIYMTLLVPIIK